MIDKRSTSKGSSISDVSSEEEGGGSPSKQMKWDENKYLVLSKADVVFDHPKKLWKPTRIGIFEYPKKLWNLKIIVT